MQRIPPPHPYPGCRTRRGTHQNGYEGGLFADPGWTIGTSESFEDSGGSFLCQKCFENEQGEGRVKEG
jgi:hypothetical protein